MTLVITLEVDIPHIVLIFNYHCRYFFVLHFSRRILLAVLEVDPRALHEDGGLGGGQGGLRHRRGRRRRRSNGREAAGSGRRRL